jgi:predicted Zn finger-like uncharacterized protein
MRIACPSCQAVYDVPPKMAARRRVRCARCRHEFVPDSLDESPPAAEPRVDMQAVMPIADPVPRLTWPEPPVGPADRLHVDIGPSIVPRPQPSSRARGIETAMALSLSVLVLCAAGAAAYVWRSDVMAAWPPSQRLFRALELD